MTYDFEGQLLTTATGGSTVSTFVYDALGRRYSRANGGTTTVFYYGPGGILAEKQGSTWTSAYAYGNGLIRKDGEYPMFDGLGSERTVTNSSQTVTGTIIHEAFGQTVATTGSSSNPYKFAALFGCRDDGDAGLLHIDGWLYDPQVGSPTGPDDGCTCVNYTDPLCPVHGGLLYPPTPPRGSDGGKGKASLKKLLDGGTQVTVTIDPNGPWSFGFDVKVNNTRPKKGALILEYTWDWGRKEKDKK